MNSASRTVRKLRLRASDESTIHRAVVLFEDALRTASLPDGAGRIVIVRRLALGRIDTRVAPQLVALRLEHAFAHVTRESVYAGSAAASGAPAVWFRDALDAHTRLALRLAAHEPMDARDWTSAVKAWQPGTPLVPALRSIILSLAMLPEAPTALPQWTAALVAAGQSERLAAALKAEDIPFLERAAGLRTATRAGDPPMDGSPHTDDAPFAVRPQQPEEAPVPLDQQRARSRRDGVPDPRALLRALLVAAGVEAKIDESPHTASANTAKQTGRRPRRSNEETASGRAAHPSTLPTAPSGNEAAQATRDISARERSGSGGQRVTEAEASDNLLPGHHGDPVLREGESANPQWVSPDSLTHAGGLLFLIRVLQRLGYTEWLEAQPEWERCEIARHVLAAILTRSQVAPDDPAWQLAQSSSRSRPVPRSFIAPARWRDGLARSGPLRREETGSVRTLWDASGRLLIGAWSGQCPPQLLDPWHRAGDVPSRSGGDDLAALATVAWVNAARRWLRRSARIGVAALVLRSAVQSLTPTHADLDFDAGACELRVRRAGLDLDPGWVPWLGRVVTFHYR